MAPRRDLRDPKGGKANLNGAWVDLRRAVDQEGEILESYITKTRDKEAALRFMKKALKRNGSPETIDGDGQASYKAAMKMLCNTQKQEVGHGTTNRVQLTETSSHPADSTLAAKGPVSDRCFQQELAFAGRSQVSP